MSNYLNIVVIGTGNAGGPIADFLGGLGHEVTCFDSRAKKDLPETSQNLNICSMSDLGLMVSKANVVVSAVPIDALSQVERIVVKYMARGTLFINLGSVMRPVDPYTVHPEIFIKKGITYVNLHPIYRMFIPMTKSSYGQSVMMHIEGKNTEYYKPFIKGLFEPYGATVYEIEPEAHDSMTKVAQLNHMIGSTVFSKMWSDVPEDDLNLGLVAGGPPAQAFFRGIIRSQQGPSVIGQILISHPNVLETIDSIRKGLDMIESAYVSKDPSEIVQTLKQAHERVDKSLMKKMETMINEHVQFDADFAKPHSSGEFMQEDNVTGLFGQLVASIDELGIDKTSTYAHNRADGGCKFMFGVRTEAEKIQIDNLIKEKQDELDSKKIK